MQIMEQLDRDGYALVPGVLDAAEIARLQDIVGRSLRTHGAAFNMGLTQPNAAIECPELSWLFADERVLGAYREAYVGSEMRFTGHCDIHQDSFSTWHKDTGAGDCYFEEDCFVEQCRVIKMAIYLEDHLDGSGLTVVPGSHRVSQWHRSADGAVSVATRAGDVVLFDIRLDHRGRRPSPAESTLWNLGLRSVRAARRILPTSRPIGESTALKGLARVVPHASRRSVFFTIAPNDRFGAQFARNNMSRQTSQYDASGASSYPDGLAERLQAAGLHVFEPSTTA